MPSGNTNIFKEYINRFEDLKANFNSEFRIHSDEESISKFTQNCDGKYGLEEAIESISEEIKECTDYIHDLKNTLRAEQAKDDTRYQEYIQEVESYIDEYKSVVSELERLLPYA